MVGLLVLLVSFPVLADQAIEGSYKTVSESECNFTLTLAKNGEGLFTESCRREDGSHIDDVEKRKITWKSNRNIVTVFGLGVPHEIFTVHQSLSCESIGTSGSAFGVVGYGRQNFWKAPRKCK